MRSLRASLDRLSRWAAPDGRLRRGRVALVLLGAYAVFAATWVPINRFSIGRPAHTLFLPGEDRIPFLPGFEYLYGIGYLLPVLTVAALPSTRELRRLLLAFAMTLAVAYATYLIFPVWFERPVLVVDSVATWLLSIEYLDPSYNHFPSLHTAIAWLMYFGCRDGLRRRGWLLAVVIGIAVSTVFVKQHYIVDAVYGTVLAGVAWWIAGRLEPGNMTDQADAAAREDVTGRR
jgi:membrane-associated phospholipid phosphatase